MCALTLAARVPGPGRGPRDPGVAAPALHGPRRVRLGPDTWHTWPGDACSSGCLMVAGLQSTESFLQLSTEHSSRRQLSPGSTLELESECGAAWQRCTKDDILSIGSTTGCTITKKAPTRAFSWLKAPTSAFTFKTLLRHYAKWALTPW